MIKQTITEEQVLAWLDGTFEGDPTEFETLLKANPAASALLAQHLLLKSALEQEDIPFQQVGLQEKVLMRLQRQKEIKKAKQVDRLFSLLVISVLSGIALAIYFVLVQLSLSLDHMLMLASMLVVFFFLRVTDRMDLRKRQRMIDDYLPGV